MLKKRGWEGCSGGLGCWLRVWSERALLRSCVRFVTICRQRRGRLIKMRNVPQTHHPHITLQNVVVYWNTCSLWMNKIWINEASREELCQENKIIHYSFSGTLKRSRSYAAVEDWGCSSGLRWRSVYGNTGCKEHILELCVRYPNFRMND